MTNRPALPSTAWYDCKPVPSTELPSTFTVIWTSPTLVPRNRALAWETDTQRATARVKLVTGPRLADVDVPRSPVTMPRAMGRPSMAGCQTEPSQTHTMPGSVVSVVAVLTAGAGSDAERAAAVAKFSMPPAATDVKLVPSEMYMRVPMATIIPTGRCPAG